MNETFSTATLEKAADLLIEARRDRRLAAALPESLAPRTAAEAYAIQDLVRARLGPTIGWKTGAGSPTEEPIAAPLIRSLFADSPACLSVGDFNMIGVEAELAFRLKRDIEAGDGQIGPAQVLDAMESVHAAIEIVDTRLRDWRNASPLWKLADNQTNGYFILGSGIEDWRGRDFVRPTVRLTIDGELVVAGEGGNAAGDPLRLLCWLVGHCRRERGGLRRGDVVTTGTFTGLRFIEGPAEVLAEFPGIGSAKVTFTA